jgi:hypothetical protein
MKKFILLIAAVAFVANANAQVVQVKEVPGVVITTFQGSYPSVNNVEWRKVGTFYEADYSENSNDMYVMYDPSGKIVETGQGVAVSSYPAPLTTYVKTKYKDDKIKKVYKVKDANGKTIWKGKVKEDYLIFDENGNYIRMEKD